MTDKTFFNWIYKYAEAVMELSWVGSIGNASMEVEVKAHWLKQKRNALKHIKQALDDLVS